MALGESYEEYSHAFKSASIPVLQAKYYEYSLPIAITSVVIAFSSLSSIFLVNKNKESYTILIVKLLIASVSITLSITFISNLIGVPM